MDADVGPKAAALLLISGEKGYDAAEAKLDTGLQEYRNWTQRALQAKESSSNYL